ncbi:TraB/GumN family protein [Roseovarius sp. A21]|uniref:TraB/GumN family protein n=1 Tax=Roseovarius bejariae TaxID=2576383 RepID=A0A844CVI9_9RHOB|nr:TraB/GumN family protein [Roseovarius bejariae]MRU16069.1 TraB/GumN family protein [Roseovarius bejariae]
MVRFLAVLLVFALPHVGFARCDGTDLIADMPEAEHAALVQRASSQAFAEGLLWRAVRGDTELTFFGTYHFPHEKTQAHLEAVRPYIKAADRVYLEVSNSDSAKMEREMAADPSLMFIMEGPTLPDLLGDEDWALFAAEMRARGIAPFFAAKFKPTWAAMMLGIGPCEARSGALEGKGIDMLVGDYAAEIGNPSRSLEDYRALMTMMDSFPMQDQLDMIRMFFAWSGSPDDMAYTLRQTYLQEKVALIWAFSRKMTLDLGGDTAMQDFALFEQKMLTDRNLSWVERLLEQAQDQKVFAAVGAAHLPGEVGVLRLLEDEGFTITRLPLRP